MTKDQEASTGLLLRLCGAYFFWYVVTGVSVKYFLAKGEGFPGMGSVEFLVYSTIGGSAVCLAVAIGAGWYRLESARWTTLLGVRLPSELLYIAPSGVCTAVVLTTTTLLYTLPITVMVAMVIMRGSVIVISRAVDAIQIKQGILQKRVYWQEDAGVAFALLAVAVVVVFPLLGEDGAQGSFDFARSFAALSILGSYIAAYAFRIYIMNFFKNTRGKGVKQDNKGFFALEQIAASGTLVVVALVAFASPSLFGASPPQILELRAAFLEPKPAWPWALTAGMAYGAVAFFSVFIFMFKGRTATFAGLVNRLTSLMAGTAATLVSWGLFSGRGPKPEDWASLALILVAVGFLTSAERRRAAELAAGG